MILTGALVNAAAIFLGSVAGLILKKGMSERMNDAIMKAMGLCVIYIGVSGALEGQNSLITIVAMAIATVIGEFFDFHQRLENMGAWIQSKCSPAGGGGTSVAEGFVTSSLLFCVGAMAVVGSLQSGLSLDHSTLFAKSLIDGIVAVAMASSLGYGVIFSGVLCLLYEGLIAAGAQFISPFLTDAVIAEMTCAGSLLIIGLGINMVANTKIRVMNSILAIFLPILLCRFM